MLGSASVFRRKLLSWYDSAKRDLPWRLVGPSGRPDPYHVLVSEAMLQQTQVATVIPYFHRFLARFSTLASLAEADEQDVLRLWQGLGYYSRARNLREAAKAVVTDHGGDIPSTVEELLDLPGVGRYTAGAIASIAFDRRAPILDGNVVRVLCRIDAITEDPREKATQERLWARAEHVLPKSRIGDFNSALMELGATVCTPRSPQCLICPVRSNCAAQAAGLQEAIPPAKRAKPTPLLERTVYCIARQDDGQTQWLIEQRPATGRWAGMWQFVTTEAGDNSAPNLPLEVKNQRRIGEVAHALTHRRYRFEIVACEACQESIAPENRVWVTLAQLDQYPLPRPHVKVAEMLAGMKE